MIVDEAIEKCKAGTAVTRYMWHYLTSLRLVDNQLCLIRDGFPEPLVWTPSEDDLKADDWKEFKPPS